ncbi:unnamed protein product [Closterium sp. NIES-54]
MNSARTGHDLPALPHSPYPVAHGPTFPPVLPRVPACSPADVGKPKAVVAAERVMSRVGGVQVTPHFCRIEDKPASFFNDFNIIVLGLDSLEARSYINSLVCGFLEYSPEGELDLTSIRPMVDGGTEGFKGHARVIIPGVTPCFHCTLWLFPPQTKFPLCTLAETPRSPAHCIEYAHLIQWGEERPGEAFDADNLENIQWIYQKVLLTRHITFALFYSAMFYTQQFSPSLLSFIICSSSHCFFARVPLNSLPPPPFPSIPFFPSFVPSRPFPPSPSLPSFPPAALPPPLRSPSGSRSRAAAQHHRRHSLPHTGQTKQ